MALVCHCTGFLGLYKREINKFFDILSLLTKPELVQTKFEMSIHQMKASQFFSSVKKVYVTSSGVYDRDWVKLHHTVPRRCDDICCLLLQVPARLFFQHSSWNNNPSFSIAMYDGTPLLLLRSSCAAGNGKF